MEDASQYQRDRMDAEDVVEQKEVEEELSETEEKPIDVEPSKRSLRVINKPRSYITRGGQDTALIDHWNDLAVDGYDAQLETDEKTRNELIEIAEGIQKKTVSKAEPKRGGRKAPGAKNPDLDVTAITLHPTGRSLSDPEDKNAKQYLIAFNSGGETALTKYLTEDKGLKGKKLKAELAKYEIVGGKGQGYQLHAEMRVMEALESSPEGSKNKKSFIAVSRPCCRKCAAALSVSGYGYRGCHGRAYRWRIPDSIRNNREKLGLFLNMKIGPTDSLDRKDVAEKISVAESAAEQSKNPKTTGWVLETGEPHSKGNKERLSKLRAKELKPKAFFHRSWWKAQAMDGQRKEKQAHSPEMERKLKKGEEMEVSPASSPEAERKLKKGEEMEVSPASSPEAERKLKKKEKQVASPVMPARRIQPRRGVKRKTPEGNIPF